MRGLVLLAVAFAISVSVTGVQRLQGGPKSGEAAPDFTLKVVGEDKKFTLKDNFGKRPTVLIFGSYT